MDPVSILWVGPGMSELYRTMPWWLNTWEYLINHQGFKISHLKLIDIIDEPLPFFGEAWAKKHGLIQETARQDFFTISPDDGWDIIIIDFVEAWMLGKRFWPNLLVTPYEFILARWEQKLQELDPKEIWVVHDTLPESTIIPELAETYDLIVDTERKFSHSELWDPQALEQFNFWKRLSVWRRKDLRTNPDESIREIEKSWEAEPTLHNFDRYYRAKLQVGQKLTRDQVEEALYPIIRDIIQQAPKGQIKTEVASEEATGSFDPSKVLDVLTEGMALDKKTGKWYGPIFEICLKEDGGIAVGSCFIKLIVDAELREFHIEWPNCAYKLPFGIVEYFHNELMRIFKEAGWEFRLLPKSAVI